MALVLQDRVRVNSAGTGTGSIVLGSAYPGYRTFASCIPDGSTVYYCIHNTSVGYDTEWEVGYGTYTLSTDTLSRTSVFASSNSDALVPFTAGANGLEVFITQPAEKAIFEEVSGETLIDGGPITVVGSGVTSIPNLPAELGKFIGNVDSFAQIYNLNQSDGTGASADFVAYNNQTTDGYNYFVDMGINSENYSSVDYPIFTPSSAYLFNDGGTLFVGSQSSDVVLFSGGVNTADIVMTANATSKSATFANSVAVTSNVSANNINVTNFVYSGANLSNAANSTVLVTQAYVDNAVSAGLTIHEAVRLETGSNLTATYDNGTAGVGATLTNSGANVALEIDGVEVALTNRILVYGQSNAAHNGVYTVTAVGAPDSPGPGEAWELTRATDADTYGVASPNALAQGSYFYVTSGNTGAGESYTVSTVGTITFGTTDITFSQFSAAPSYVVEAPLDLTGNTLTLAGVVSEAHGGTNASTYTTGDIIYANATNTLAKLAVGTAYKSLVVNAGGTAPEWNAVALNQSGAVSGALPATNGGTGQTTYTLGDIVYSNATNTLAKLAGQTTTTQKFLSQTGNGTISAAPVWDTIPAASITGLGTMSTQNANAVAITGGAINGTLIGNASPTTATFTTATATLFAGSGANLTNLNASNVASGTIANIYTTAASANGASTIVTRDASGNFAANTITANLTGTASSATSATTATTANNIAGGAAGGIPYQTGSGATSILATASGVLVGGTTPSYSTAPALTGTNFSSIPNSATTATAANTASAIVARDGSGNFTAGTITATTFSGSGASLTSIPNSATTATSANTASAIVARDGSGNFSAGTITATLNGSATSAGTATSATTAVTVTGAAQANITSVGTLTSLTSSGTITSTNGAGSSRLQADGDIYAYRSGGTTGVIFLNSAGNRYLYFDGTSYIMPGGQLVVNSQTVLNAGNYTSYAPSLTGTGASGSWSISVTGSAGTFTSTSQNSQFNSVGVGTAGSGTAGEIRATNNITAYYSDDRMKTNLGNIPNALNKVKSLNGFYYEANEVAQAMGYEVKKEVGVSAQQVQAIMPEVVAPAPIDDKYLTVRYERLVPLLIEAIKELEAQVAELKAK